MEAPGGHDQDCYQDCDEGGGIKIECPEASNRSRKLIDYLTVSFLTATFALTCFITLAVLTR